MKAAVLYEANTPVVIEDLDMEEPAQGEVMVKLGASGVCHSDWHVVKGEWTHHALPTVLGHEGAGVVEATGPGVTKVKPGDHVILSWKPNCGLCETCQKGWPNVCYDPLQSPTYRRRSDGATINRLAQLGTFAGYATVPEIAAVPIDKAVPFGQAALVGCGVTTGVGAAINTARVQPGTTVAVFGAGGVGLNVMQGAEIAGATTIIAVDILDNKLDMAMEFGATHAVNASREDPVARIMELTDGLGAHYAFEAIGLVEAPFVQSIQCTRRRGVTVWVGHAPEETPVTIDARELMQEKTVIGSMYGTARPQIEFPRLLALYKAGKLRLDELITRTYPLEEADAAFEALGRGEVARSVLTFD